MIKYFLIFFGILASGLAQIMLKKSSSFAFLKEWNFFLYFVLGGFFYVFSFGIYAYVLKMFDMSKISPIMTIGTMLLVVIAGVVFFRESLTLRQIIGVLLGFVSIVLIVK